MNIIDKKILPCLEDADALPFLFIGSGFTKRYLGLPTWEKLIEHIASLTYDDSFGLAAAKNEVNKQFNPSTDYNAYMTHLTDYISNDLDKIWYSNPKFQQSREEYGTLATEQQVEPLKIEIAKYIKSFDTTKIISKRKAKFDKLQGLANKSIAGIITTNYDTLIETIFNFETYSSQEELLFHTKYDLGEVYKIHGSVTRPGSIMINTRDYEEIDKKHKYISAKLLTIFVEHPIFFIGYSLEDQDIRNILADIQMGLTPDQLKVIERRLFFVTWDDTVTEPEVSTLTISFQEGTSLTIGKIALNDYSDLYDVLAQTSNKYPVKLLRYAKQDLYQFTLTTKPSKKIVLSVPDKDVNSESLKNVEFIYGFGIIERAEKGYASVDKDEIYRDVVFDDQNFVAQMLAKEALPNALRQASGYIPVRKYTRGLCRDELPSIVNKNLDRFSTYNSFLPGSLRKQIKNHGYLTADDAINNPGEDYYRLAQVKWTKDNLKLLHETLIKILNGNHMKFKDSGGLRRLIRIYDFVQYS